MYFRKMHIRGLQKDLVVYWHSAVSKTVKMGVSHECYTSGVYEDGDVTAIVKFLKDALQ